MLTFVERGTSVGNNVASVSWGSIDAGDEGQEKDCDDRKDHVGRRRVQRI